MIWAGTFLAILSIAVLHYAWRRPRRVTALNSLAWGLLLLGLVLGGVADGAWGVTVAALAATATALALLVPDALTARPQPQRGSERRANMLPERAPLRLGRRASTFVLTVPAALIVAVLLSVGAHALAGLAGWHPADSVVLALMLMPLLWAILATLVLMTRRA
jgi:hypothetical protein